MSAVVYQEPYSPSTRGDRFGAMAPYRQHPHRGQDWAPGAVPALAIADGVVALSQWSDVLGNVLVLRHADGKFSGYCHLASKPTAKVGDHVARHHSIGATIGQTGSAATGRHLHLTLSNGVQGVFYGEVEDPLAWILAHDEPAPQAKPQPSTGGRKQTTVRANEGLRAVAARVGISFDRIRQLNPNVKGPTYPLALGQKLWTS